MSYEYKVQRINELEPNPKNARQHSPEQVKKLTRLIDEYGFTNPILVNESNMVIAGHGRLEAATEIGIDEVPTIILAGLSDSQCRALAIADNRIPQDAKWDIKMLAAELSDLHELGMDMDLTAFESAELDAYLLPDEPESDEPNPDDENIPEVSDESITKPGDVWLLGDHIVMCGDSTMHDDVANLMGEAAASMAFTDPPYNVNYDGGAYTERQEIKNDSLGGRFGEFLGDAIKNLLLFTEGAVYISMSSSELATLRQAFDEAGGHWSDYLIWAKQHFTLGRSDYHRQYEPILYGWRKGAKHYWCGARDKGNVITHSRPVKSELHPTMKPVGLVEGLIKNSSKRDGIVLDLFGGSGTTLIACENTGRKCRMMELDPKYVDVIVKRWQEKTQQEAVLRGSDETFDSIEDGALAIEV